MEFIDIYDNLGQKSGKTEDKDRLSDGHALNVPRFFEKKQQKHFSEK